MTKKNATRQRPPDEINARCQARRRLNGRPGWTPQALPPTDGTRNTNSTSKYEHHPQTVRTSPADDSSDHRQDELVSKQYEHHQQTIRIPTDEIQTPPADDSNLGAWAVEKLQGNHLQLGLPESLTSDFFESAKIPWNYEFLGGGISTAHAPSGQYEPRQQRSKLPLLSHITSWHHLCWQNCAK